MYSLAEAASEGDVRAEQDVTPGQAREADVGEGEAEPRMRLDVVVDAPLQRSAGQRDESADKLMLVPHRLLEGSRGASTVGPLATRPSDS